MPRKPGNPHVLRTIRARHELSQPALARLVGVEAITIKKIESGQLKLSRKLAHRISIATGADPQQLIDNFEPQTPYLVGAHPEELTRESVQARRKPKLKDVDEAARILGQAIQEMLRASVRKGSIWVLWYALRQAIQELSEEFDLPVHAYKGGAARDMLFGKSRQKARASQGLTRLR
jgi:transcriptional regulator with XRE-family HTH domain